MTYLGQCHFCGEAVFKLDLLTGPDGPTDIDWRPWTIDEELPPVVDGNGKPVTKATLRRWEEERPYRLGLVVIDLQRGKYQAATDTPRGKLRSKVMYRLHFCTEKEAALYGNASTTTKTVGD